MPAVDSPLLILAKSARMGEAITASLSFGSVRLTSRRLTGADDENRLSPGVQQEVGASFPSTKKHTTNQGAKEGAKQDGGDVTLETHRKGSLGALDSAQLDRDGVVRGAAYSTSL